MMCLCYSIIMFLSGLTVVVISPFTNKRIWGDEAKVRCRVFENVKEVALMYSKTMILFLVTAVSASGVFFGTSEVVNGLGSTESSLYVEVFRISPIESWHEGLYLHSNYTSHLITAYSLPQSPPLPPNQVSTPSLSPLNPYHIPPQPNLPPPPPTPLPHNPEPELNSRPLPPIPQIQPQPPQHIPQHAPRNRMPLTLPSHQNAYPGAGLPIEFRKVTKGQVARERAVDAVALDLLLGDVVRDV